MNNDRDIIIELDNVSITKEDVEIQLAKFVGVLSIQNVSSTTLHARLYSSTHVDHLLNVLSGRLRIGKLMCSFYRPKSSEITEDHSDDECSFGEILTAGSDCSIHATTIPVPIQNVDTSVFLTPPNSLSQSSIMDEIMECPLSPMESDITPPSPMTIPIGLHPEYTIVDPSPMRPENRVPRRRVCELQEIYDRGVMEVSQDEPKLTPNYESTQYFLPLAPPYHLLPNTPYFRNAPIAPPPTKPSLPVSTHQRIINRYLESMKVMDMYDEMETQSIMHFPFNRTIGEWPQVLEHQPVSYNPHNMYTDTSRDDTVTGSLGGWSIWKRPDVLLHNPN